MPHYWRIPEPDYNLDWAFKKNIWKKKRRKDNSKEMRNKKKKKKKKRYRPKKKKVRGALKKELLRKERKEFPFGRPMYSLRSVPAHREIIFPKDIERIHGYHPRTARRYIAKLRKHLGKTKDQPVFLDEYCKYAGAERNRIIMFLV
jgi:hypothetical protein